MSHQRSACDRCRAQKLRCPRRDQPSREPCSRCLKIGVECVTSSARPLGRPRRAEVAGRHTRSIKTRTTALEARGTGSTSSCLSSTTENIQAHPDLGTPGRLDSYPNYLQSPSYETTSHFEDPSQSSQFGVNVGHAFDLQLGLHDDLFTLGPETELFQCSQHTFGLPATAENHIPGPSSKLLEPADTLTALSRLNEDIVRQVSNVDVYIWGAANAGQDCLERFHQVEGNPTAEMLQSTSQFVNILEDLAASSKSPNKSIARSVELGSTASDSGISDFRQRHISPPALPSSVHPPSTNPSLLSTPVVLMLLSSYLLLLELYNAVFRRVHDALSKLGDIHSFLQALPEVRVAGLPSMKTHLYAKIIIQIIEHHFDQLERLLGLPKEFGLSGRTPDSKGLLSTTDLSQLLRVAMTQTSGKPGSSGISTLKSFKASLRGLRGMFLG
ncbi:hypothetical protein AYL99_08379 [Fonsecaea erecta]|uniref:Zn(2)-C6 fungal-type domain-containing protein n=1 Tax=Fonsecaea erecta TaxID=1367422 RepID=A0A178ZDV9_9EURO|nr:hypothetical protein AYL99_08379 [Fonsecaea erecta]OAP57641.1 hypothetical protein AYL99_08379 [Fonsecaea erecta]